MTYRGIFRLAPGPYSLRMTASQPWYGLFIHTLRYTDSWIHRHEVMLHSIELCVAGVNKSAAYMQVLRSG